VCGLERLVGGCTCHGLPVRTLCATLHRPLSSRHAQQLTRDPEELGRLVGRAGRSPRCTARSARPARRARRARGGAPAAPGARLAQEALRRRRARPVQRVGHVLQLRPRHRRHRVRRQPARKLVAHRRKQRRVAGVHLPRAPRGAWGRHNPALHQRGSAWSSAAATRAAQRPARRGVAEAHGNPAACALACQATSLRLCAAVPAPWWHCFTIRDFQGGLAPSTRSRTGPWVGEACVHDGSASRPGPQPRATARPSEDPTLPLAPRPSPAARTSATATASVAICHVLHSGSSAARSASSGGSSSSYTRRDCSPLSNTLRAPRHSLWRGCSLWRGAMRGAARGERGAWARRRGASESTGRGCPLLTARRVKKAATGGARGRRAGRTDGAA